MCGKRFNVKHTMCHYLETEDGITRYLQYEDTQNVKAKATFSLGGFSLKTF